MKHDFRHEQVQMRNDSLLQQKFRRIRPWPVGVVFVQWPGMTLEEIREQFREFRTFGFTALKQICLLETTDRKKVMHIALDEGLIPWWYGEAGWEAPTPELLEQLGLHREISMQDLRENRTWLSRQETVMRARIDGGEPDVALTASDNDNEDLPGVLHKFTYGLEDAFADLFTQWLIHRYGTVDRLKEAWNFHHCLIRTYPWETWEDIGKGVIVAVNQEKGEYRRIVDVLTFKAGIGTEKIRKHCEKIVRRDPHAPVRAGGEMSLFLNMPNFGTDMEQIAGVMRDYGSYYPSMHIAWHFEETGYEIARPLYLQASMAVDWFKGGWSATWESTAGPQLFTGGKGLYKPAEWQVPGCTIDADTMCQIMLTWIAAGFRGFGLWCANPRTAGWEAGEYGLYDSDNQPTARAEVAGRIGSACRTYRDELWDCHKEPEVGVYMDWTADAFWAAVAVGSRDLFAHMPTLARVGAGRMLLNHNIPFEFVTGKDLHEGLADRYKVIYLPAIIALDADLLPVLTSYARQGGHVIIDTPTAWLDIQGRIMETSVGSLFENLFGARMANIQYARPLNKPWKLDGHLMEGMTADLVPTTAHVTRRFDDGKVAVTEHFVGKGSASIIAFAAAVSCHKPNNGFVESFMANHFMKHLSLPFSCEGVLAYRLCGNGVRHYFLVNDGESRHVKLNADETYKQVTDVLSGEQVDIAQTLAVDRYGARWLRAER